MFPEIMKTASIKAIYKKGEKNVINNYRAVALLSNISKIFEKIIYNRLIHFLEKHQVISDTQNGFRKNKSTIRAAYQSLCKILTLTQTVAISKAFDSVEHDILVTKLENYGIRGIPKKLIASYLRNRSQCVIEKDENNTLVKSDPMTIQRGIPQGSISRSSVIYFIHR